MGKNVDHVQHIKSNIVVKSNGVKSPKLPNPSALTEGEIAINYAKDYETISLKNESGDVVTFSSDKMFYTKSETSGSTQLSTAFGAIDTKVGSGFTSSSITDVIIENEEIVSAALADLDERKLDTSAYTPSVELWVSGTGENAVTQKGSNNIASGYCSIAEGYSNKATEMASHAEGRTTSATGYDAHSEGQSTLASGSQSHAEGYKTVASSNQSHAEGNGTSATSYSSHAEGYYTKANGSYSHAEGYSTTASGDSSHAEGQGTKADGYYSHAEGSNTKASGYYSHAEGLGTSATTYNSHAEGVSTVASGYSSHAEGGSTKASGSYSHAEGSVTTASGDYSHAEGNYTIANNQSEHASGQFNVSNSATTTFGDSGNTLFSVGNGTADDARHNAFEIRQNGDIYIASGNSDIKLQDYIGNITIDQTIDSGTSASTNAVSTSAVYGFVTSYTPSITVDQVLDDTTSASTNPVSSKAVYDAVTDNELVWTNAYVALSGTVSAHTDDTSIHLVSGDREKLNSITGTFGSMAYEDVSSYSSATEVNTALAGKQENLESGVNIKTINNETILGNGNIEIASGGFKVIENSNSATTKGLVNSLSTHYDTNIGKYAVIEGDGGQYMEPNPRNIVASGNYSHAEGFGTSATTSQAHAEGFITLASGQLSHAEGSATTANGNSSHAEGVGTKASGQSSHAEGQSTIASGNSSHAEGYKTSATTWEAHSEGDSTSASGVASHAEGSYTKAIGHHSHTEGDSTSATSQNAHAEGNNTLASGENSHAEGERTIASNYRSHAEGYNTIASGVDSHAEGQSTSATSFASHVEGYYTETKNSYEHASGQYNVSSSGSSTFGDSGNTLFSVGNGTSSNARHNAFEIRQNGDIYIASGNSDIKLQDYIGNVETVTAITPSNSGSTDPIATKVVAENELTVTNALNDLNTNKADKSTTYTKTEIDDMIGDIETLLAAI